MVALAVAPSTCTEDRGVTGAIEPVGEMAPAGPDRTAPHVEPQLLGLEGTFSGRINEIEERLVEHGEGRIAARAPGLGGDALALSRGEHVPSST